MTSSTRLLLLGVFITLCHGHNKDVHVTILHTSDVTSSFEQYDSAGEKCSEEEDQLGLCLGGVPRRGTIINQVRNERDDINVLLLDAGDQFVGDWFNVYKGEATSYFMNRLEYDAMTFGNLEFALGPDGLASFLEDINFDTVSANLNVTNEPVLQGLFNKSVVKMIDGQAVGIVGYTVQRTNDIALVRDAYFEDVIQAVQREVDALTSRGVNKIIVLGHSYGFVTDGSEVLEIARNIRGVDVIVFGGALLFQYDSDGCPYIEEDVVGAYLPEPYPIVVTPNYDPDGKVLLVHGYIDGTYIGRLNVIFDEEGNVSEWYGKPIRLDKEVEQAPELLAEIKQYAEGVENAINRLLGRTLVKLQGSIAGSQACRKAECNMGNLITEAMVWKYVTYFEEKKWNNVSIGVMNGGGIRASIQKGEIRYSDVSRVLPFSNTFDVVEIKGVYIREMLEHAVAGYENFAGSFLQMSGMKVVYDVTRKPYNNRVIEVLVQCTDCKIPQFFPLDDEKVYMIVVPSFIGGGGDGFGMIKDNAMNYVTGETGEDIVAQYIEKFSPIFPGVDGRIKFVDLEQPTTPTPPELSTSPDPSSPTPSAPAGSSPGNDRPQKPTKPSTQAPSTTKTGSTVSS